jgi:hypothetical protein
MDEIDPKSPHVQTALAMSAVAVAFARTLQELIPDEDALAILQSKAAVGLTILRQTPDAEIATAIFRFVRDRLCDPNVIEQPAD